MIVQLQNNFKKDFKITKKKLFGEKRWQKVNSYLSNRHWHLIAIIIYLFFLVNVDAGGVFIQGKILVQKT